MLRRASNKTFKTAKIQAISASMSATWDQHSRYLDGKTLQTLTTSYPKGNIWYMGDEGFFSSLEQVNEQRHMSSAKSSQRRSLSPNYLAKQRTEAAYLSATFHKARQIIFIPLWDAGANRWFSGCFVWTQFSVPVWTVDSEV